jgi:hypothetical protein
VYGVVQWMREPRLTWQARSLAIEHGYGMFESLRAARDHVRNAARRNAIAGTVAEYIRSEHQDERLAKIAETTYDADRLAGMLEERINYEVVTNKLTRAISPPPEEPPAEERNDLRAAVWVVEGKALKAQQVRADGGVNIRDEDAWGEAMTGELMAIVDPPVNAEGVAEAEVVEDEAEHVVNGVRKPVKASPVVQKPQEPSPFAPADQVARPGVPEPVVESVLPPVLPEPVVVEPVVAQPAKPAKAKPAAKVVPAEGEPEPTDLEKRRMRAWNMLGDWPEGHERSAKKLAEAIGCSEPMASRFIEQYESEHDLVSQN